MALSWQASTLLSQGDNESPSGTDIPKTRKMCSLRRNSWEAASYCQFGKKKKKIPKSSSPMGNTVCIAALKCWTNTNQSHSSLQSGRCNSVIRSWVQGGWVYWVVTVCSRPKAARTVDYADCTSRTLMCTWITRGSFKSRFGFSWSGVGPETPHS